MQVFDSKRAAAPKANFLWQLATRLGAACSLQLSEGTTHVVALCAHTDKCHAAAKQGAKLVHPEWLLACEAQCAAPSRCCSFIETCSFVETCSCIETCYLLRPVHCVFRLSLFISTLSLLRPVPPHDMALRPDRLCRPLGSCKQPDLACADRGS